MILPETVADVVGAESSAGTEAPARATDAEAAAARVRADYGRAARWALGAVGTLGAAAAWAVVCFGIEFATTGARPAFDLAFSGIILVAGAILGVPSVWLLAALHRSGRRLARAAALWSQRAGRTSSADVLQIRSLAPDLAIRLGTSAVAALAALVAIAGAVGGAVSGAGPALICLYAGWAVLAGTTSLGQFGGVQRVGSRMPAVAPPPARHR